MPISRQAVVSEEGMGDCGDENFELVKRGGCTFYDQNTTMRIFVTMMLK